MYSAQLKHYKKVEVETASKEKLLVMVFNGAIQFCETAKISYTEDNILDGQYYLSRVQCIVMELMSSLNMERGGQIASNLLDLYEYVLSALIEVREGNVEVLDDIISLLSGLKDAWQDIASGKNIVEEVAETEKDDVPEMVMATSSSPTKHISFTG